MTTALEILERLPLWSVERPGIPASRSEIKRWIANKAVTVNGRIAGMDVLTESVQEIVLFGKSRRKTTLGPAIDDSPLCGDWNKIFKL